MNKFLKYFTRFNFFITTLILILYGAIRFVIVFLREYPKGDEPSFLAIFKIFIDDGYYKANAIGNSTSFNSIAYLFYKITSNELMSLRLTSLFFGILSLIILWIFYKKFFKIPDNYRLMAFLTAVNSIVIMSWIFTGIDDIILAFLTVLFFYLIFKLRNYQKQSNILYLFIGAIIALMLLTREMSILFYPSIAIVLFSLFYLKKEPLKMSLIKGSLIILSFIVVLVVFNLPSIIENRKLSFHDKKIDSPYVNWNQLLYLTAIGEEQGKLAHGEYYSVDQVAKYLKENGQESLPKSYSEQLFFDFNRTIKEFFKDLIYEFKPLTRLLGFIFIINILLFIRYLLKRNFILKNILNQQILLFSISYILVVCFIIVDYVDTRWFSNILLLLPIVFAERIYKFKIENKLGANFDFYVINLQLLSLAVMSLPYLIKNIGILF